MVIYPSYDGFYRAINWITRKLSDDNPPNTPSVTANNPVASVSSPPVASTAPANSHEGILFNTETVQITRSLPNGVSTNESWQNGGIIGPGAPNPTATKVSPGLIEGVDPNAIQGLRTRLQAVYISRYGPQEGPNKFAQQPWNINSLLEEYKAIKFSTEAWAQTARQNGTFQLLETTIKTIKTNAEKPANNASNILARINNALSWLPPINPAQSYSREAFFRMVGDFDGAIQNGIVALYGPAHSGKINEPWTFDRFIGLYVDIVDQQNNPAERRKTEALLPKMRTALERLLHIQSGTADTFFAQFGSNETPIKNAISSLYGSSSTEKMREAWTLDRFVGLYVDVLDHREERSEKQKADTVIPIYTAIFAARLQDAAQPPATPENSTSLAPSTSEQFFGSFPFGDTLKTYISGLYGPAAEQKMSELWTIDRFTGLYSDLVRNQNNPADKAKIAATLPLMRQGLFQLLVKAQPAAGQPAPTEPNPAIAQITPLLKVGEFDAPTFQAVVTNTIVALTTEHKKDGTPPFDANKIKADPRYKALQALMGTDSFMNPDFAREGNPVRTIIAGWKDNTEIGRGCIAILTTLYSTTAGQPSIIDTTANPTMVADLGIMTNNAASDAALINAASGVTAPTETPAATTAPAPGTAIPQGTFIRTDVSGTTYARSGEKFFKVTENKWEEEYTPGAPKPTTPCNSHTNPIRVTYINGQRYFVARADNGRDYVINDNQWTNSRVELRQPTADLDAGADASLAPIIITE